ncbi:MAG: hypothetical protein V4475_11900 [Pseudomonadota bacterium]
MTFTLLFGGMLWFGLACRLVWGTGATEKRTRVAGFLLAALGPIVGILMIHFALAEGAATATAPDTAGRLAGQTRLALLEATIDRTDASRGLTIGGDPAVDDIVVADFPAGAVALTEVEGATRVALTARPNEQVRPELFVNGTRVAAGSYRDAAGAAAITVALMSPRDAIPASVKNLPERSVRLTVTRTQRAWHTAFALPEIKVASGGNVQPASADLENQPREGDNVIAFQTLGGTFAPLLEQVELVLPQVAGLNTYVSGANPGYQDNQRVVIGGAGLEVVLRVDPLNLTSGLRGYAGLVASLVLLASMVVHWRIRRDSPLVAMLLGIAEVLLVLRIIIALEGGMVEETLRSRNALGDALVALPLGLLALGATIGPLRRLPIQVLALGGSAACLMGLIGAVSHGIPRTSWQVAFALTLLTAVGATLTQSLPWILRNAGEVEERLAVLSSRAASAMAPLRSRALQGAGQIGRQLHALVARWQPPAWAQREWLFPILLSFGGGLLILLARMLLVGFKVEERFLGDSGSGGALSIGFVPLTLLAATPLLRQLTRCENGAQFLSGGIAYLTFLILFAVLPNAIANDMGLAVVLVLGLALAAAGGRLVQAMPVGWRTWLTVAAGGMAAALGLAGWVADNANWWLVPLMLLGLALALQLWARSAEALGTSLWLGPAAALIAVVFLTAVPQLRPGMNAAPRDAGAMLVKSTAQLRLIAALAPERLDFQVSSRAADLREAISHLSRYVENPEGRRMLNLPLPPAGVKKQQFSDYVVAIHVISPFGRLAAAGLLLMLAGLATLSFVRVAERRGVAWFGVLSIMIFTTTSIYITLANALLAPFTGRNFYLLAVQSTSDLVEGLLLLVLAAATLAAPKRETPA